MIRLEPSRAQAQAALVEAQERARSLRADLEASRGARRAEGEALRGFTAAAKTNVGQSATAKSAAASAARGARAAQLVALRRAAETTDLAQACMCMCMCTACAP